VQIGLKWRFFVSKCPISVPVSLLRTPNIRSMHTALLRGPTTQHEDQVRIPIGHPG
jgi:hypothetical protein